MGTLWTMRARGCLVAILLCVMTVLAMPAATQGVSEREGKRLWRMSLCGAMVIADPGRS